MKDGLGLNFGVVIAFLLPGFILLYGFSLVDDSVESAFMYTSTHDTGVGGFLFASLASLALGLMVSAVRWLILDHIFEWMGLSKTMDFSKLSDANKYNAFMGVVENHYRYFQYYSNTSISILIAWIVYVIAKAPVIPWEQTCGLLIVFIALLAGAHNAFKKYHERGSAILQ